MNKATNGIISFADGKIRSKGARLHCKRCSGCLSPTGFEISITTAEQVPPEGVSFFELFLECVSCGFPYVLTVEGLNDTSS